MTSTIFAEFTIPGRVRGKGRPRFGTGKKNLPGGKVQHFTRAYTDEATVNAEAMVRLLAAQAMRGRQATFRAVSLEVFIILNPPPSWSKKRQRETRWATGKPDVDNIVKLIGDAFNKMVWHDDGQLAVVSIRREYRLDEAERVRIRVCELEDSALNQLEPPAPALNPMLPFDEIAA